uniref:glutathione transferase n=1 Tax=Cuerna arida TaxID=1464854 RepID=A0A1B6EVG9_9HEMI
MASQIKLTYFPIIGLAEPIRFLLAYLGKEYEDFRFDRKDWPEIKKGTPWGKSPVLEIGGQQVTQSIAISRYLGKEAGLAGGDSWEDLRIDEIVGVIDDLRAEIANFHYDPDEVRKAGKIVSLVNEIVPFYMKKLDAHVKENNGFLANGKLSWADFYFSAISEYLSYMYRSDITDGYPNVKDLKMRIYALPAIKAWIDRRPANIYPTYPNL